MQRQGSALTMRQLGQGFPHHGFPLAGDGTVQSVGLLVDSMLRLFQRTQRTAPTHIEASVEHDAIDPGRKSCSDVGPPSGCHHPHLQERFLHNLLSIRTVADDACGQSQQRSGMALHQSTESVLLSVRNALQQQIIVGFAGLRCLAAFPSQVLALTGKPTPNLLPRAIRRDPCGRLGNLCGMHPKFFGGLAARFGLAAASNL